MKAELKKLTEQDYQAAAEMIGCDLAAIKAVTEVESRGSGFLPNGKPVILFEAHIFSRRTARKFDRSHPHISSRVWNKKLYKGGVREYDRMQEAMLLDREAALKSASWGLFQIMGFNFKEAGFESVEAFVEAMNKSEGEHLKAFCKFVQSKRLDRALRAHAWASFALGYNGEGYKENEYDKKLAQAYRKYAPPPGNNLAAPAQPAVDTSNMPVPTNIKIAAIAFGRLLCGGYKRVVAWLAGLGIALDAGIFGSYPWLILILIVALMVVFVIYYFRKVKQS